MRKIDILNITGIYSENHPVHSKHISDASFFANDRHDIMFYMFADRFMQIEIKGLSGSNGARFANL